MHNFLKIHAHLGVRLPRKAYFVEFTFSFFTQESVIVFLIAQPIRDQLRAFVWVWRWRWWWKGYILNTCTYWTYMSGCMSVAVHTSLCCFMFQLCLWGSFTARQFYNSPFGAIYIDHTGCQAQAQNTGFFWVALFRSFSLSICFPYSSLTHFMLLIFFTLTMNTFQDNYGITLKIKLKAYCVFNNLD